MYSTLPAVCNSWGVSCEHGDTHQRLSMQCSSCWWSHAARCWGRSGESWPAPHSRPALGSTQSCPSPAAAGLSAFPQHTHQSAKGHKRHWWDHLMLLRSPSPRQCVTRYCSINKPFAIRTLHITELPKVLPWSSQTPITSTSHYPKKNWADHFHLKSSRMYPSW